MRRARAGWSAPSPASRTRYLARNWGLCPRFGAKNTEGPARSDGEVAGMRYAGRSLLTVGLAVGLLAGLTVGTTGAGAATTFRTPVVVSNADDSEPGIDVAPDGTMYISAI